MRQLRSVIRFTLFLLATFGLYVIWYIGAFFVQNKQFWRQIVFHKWAQAFVIIAGMKIEVIGTPPKPPFFLVSNHLSYTDIPAYRAVIETVFVAKADIESLVSRR